MPYFITYKIMMHLQKTERAQTPLFINVTLGYIYYKIHCSKCPNICVFWLVHSLNKLKHFITRFPVSTARQPYVLLLWTPDVCRNQVTTSHFTSCTHVWWRGDSMYEQGRQLVGRGISIKLLRSTILSAILPSSACIYLPWDTSTSTTSGTLLRAYVGCPEPQHVEKLPS